MSFIIEKATLPIYNIYMHYTCIRISKGSAKKTHFFTVGGGGVRLFAYSTKHLQHLSLSQIIQRISTVPLCMIRGRRYRAVRRGSKPRGDWILTLNVPHCLPKPSLLIICWTVCCTEEQQASARSYVQPIPSSRLQNAVQVNSCPTLQASISSVSNT